MKNDDITRDDLLGKMLRNTALESPGDAFVGNVMKKITRQPLPEPWSAILVRYVKNSWVYAVISVAVIIFLYTSDLPYNNFLPGKGFFMNTVIPYFGSIFSNMKLSGEIKTFPIPLMILAAVAFLLILERLVSGKPRMKHTIIL